MSNNKIKFVHLHVHTEYSLLDGLSKIKPLINYVKEMGMDALAVTDHGAMYGAIEFYKKAKELDLKPIIGIEGYISPDMLVKEKGESQNYHIILLAKNEEGYKNLMTLTSKAHVEGYYYRPRFDFELLKKHAKGLIMTTACGKGELKQILFQEQFKSADEYMNKYLDLFGEDFYIEIQRRDYDKFIKEAKDPEIKSQLREMKEFEEKVNPLLYKISREYAVPMIATNDSHYIKKEDATAQDATVCISTGKVVGDIKRMRYIDIPDFYIKSPEEMYEIYKDKKELLENTLKVAEKCNLEITTLGKWFFPKFKLEEGLTANDELRRVVYDRAKDKYGKLDKERKDRTEYELDIIINKGYAPYFLIVADMVNWANSKGIVTNTRGSAAGSLVSYIMGITTVDPIEYYLPFERFLNPYRPSPPDIDLDVSDIRREEVIEYICNTYGWDKVAQICTFGRMLSRAAVRDVARVLGYPYAVGDKIAKLIPPPKQGFPITIPKALEETPDLNDLYETDKDAKKVLDLAKIIEGNARHISVHAAGVVVSPSTLTNFSPIQKEPSGEKIITQYEMHACEDVGLIKFDILGIRNLSILGEAVRIVKETTGEDVDLINLPLDDKKTFKMLGRGETMGTFQMGGSGMTKYLKDLKPERVEDLMAMVALYRPGPLQVIPEYIKRKKNPRLVKYLDPRMEKFLESSYGLIVYQDDLLFCAIDLAGYSWEEADKFRKAVGKKIPEEMAAQKEKFEKGIVENGQTKEFAENLWKLFEPFQSYGFNKAHAASYGMVAYQTSYMKANYPVEYMTALLTAESDDKEKVSEAINECRRMKIKVLPPDINESSEGFNIVNDKESARGKAIRFGLNAIKNVGVAAITSIIEARKDGEFLNFADFLRRVDTRRVNKKVLESLIKVGALSKFGRRSSLLSSIDEVRAKLPKKEDENQPGLFASEEIKKASEGSITFEIKEIPEFNEEELEELERQLMGFSMSAVPISEKLKHIQDYATHKINELVEMEDLKDEVAIACLIREVRKITTRKTNQEMAFIKIEDSTGFLQAVVFPSVYDDIKNELNENSIVIVKGKLTKKDDELSLIVNLIEERGEVEHIEGNLFIKIPKDAGIDELRRLKKLLEKFPGNKKVTLVFPDNNEKINLKINVDWNDKLASQISMILKSSNVS